MVCMIGGEVFNLLAYGYSPTSLVRLRSAFATASDATDHAVFMPGCGPTRG